MICYVLFVMFVVIERKYFIYRGCSGSLNHIATESEEIE